MQIKPLGKEVEVSIGKYGLRHKWNKAKPLFETNIGYPSLHAELLEPHWRGVYSFRIDRKYRALFFITEGKAEVFKITKHYKK